MMGYVVPESLLRRPPYPPKVIKVDRYSNTCYSAVTGEDIGYLILQEGKLRPIRLRTLYTREAPHVTIIECSTARLRLFYGGVYRTRNKRVPPVRAYNDPGPHVSRRTGRHQPCPDDTAIFP
jgi:hypothetical protein